MRILILSQYFEPEPIPKPFELAQALQQNGHSVSVITGYPNYPSGRLYSGYRLRLVHQETIDGIKVIRTYEFPYHGRSVFLRILNYVSFMISAVLGSFFAPRSDVMYVWHPPLTVGVAAWLISRLRRVPFVYDVQDIWPEAAVLSGMLSDNWFVSLISRLERFVYRRADRILVVTEGARKNLLDKGTLPSKVAAMPHWADEKMFMSSSPDARRAIRSDHGWGRDFVVLFAGNIGLVQGLDTAVTAAGLLPVGCDIRLVIIGDGADKARLQALVEQKRLQDRMQFIDRQPVERIPDFMAAADVLLVHLKRSQLSEWVIPSKTMAYLASGRPILMAMEGAAAQLVQAAGAGLVIRPEDPDALAEAIVTLTKKPEASLRVMGERGRGYLIAHLSRDKVILNYEAVLRETAESAGRGAHQAVPGADLQATQPLRWP